MGRLVHHLLQAVDRANVTKSAKFFIHRRVPNLFRAHALPVPELGDQLNWSDTTGLDKHGKRGVSGEACGWRLNGTVSEATDF